MEHDLKDCPLDLEYSILFTNNSVECSPQLLNMIETLKLPLDSLKETTPIHKIHGHSFYTCRHEVPGGHLLCLFPIDKLIELYNRPLISCGKVLYSIHMSQIGKILASYPVPMNGKNLMEWIVNQDIALLCQTLSIVSKRQQKRIVSVRWIHHDSEKTQINSTETLNSAYEWVTLTIFPVLSIEKTIEFNVLIQFKEPDTSLGLFSLIPQTLSYLFKKF